MLTQIQIFNQPRIVIFTSISSRWIQNHQTILFEKLHFQQFSFMETRNRKLTYFRSVVFLRFNQKLKTSNFKETSEKLEVIHIDWLSFTNYKPFMVIPIRAVCRSDYLNLLKVFTTLTYLTQTMAWRSHGTNNEELITKLRGMLLYHFPWQEI